MYCFYPCRLCTNVCHTDLVTDRASFKLSNVDVTKKYYLQAAAKQPNLEFVAVLPQRCGTNLPGKHVFIFSSKSSHLINSHVNSS